MKKEQYKRAEMEVIEFKLKDVLLTSDDPDEYEGEIAVIRLPRI